MLLTGGAEAPRDLNVPGRELKGIHFAMEFLPQQNKRNAGDDVPGSDSGHRQARGDHRRRRHRRGLPGHLPPAEGEVRAANSRSCRMPPAERSPSTPWPLWPLQLRTESAHEEGGDRAWAIATTKFTGDEKGNVKQLHADRVGPPPKFEPMPGTEFVMDADLVLLALGFTGPGEAGHDRAVGREPRRARQHRHGELHEFGARRFRRGRHAPRPVAGGVGDLRGPQGRRRRRYLPHGQHPAEVSRSAVKENSLRQSQHSRPFLSRSIDSWTV